MTVIIGEATSIKPNSAVTSIMDALIYITESLPIGTNLGMLHILWTIISGKLLPNRGGLYPALQDSNLDEAEINRAWAAFRHGVWRMPELLTLWQEYVQNEGRWQTRSYEGWHPKAIDLVAFFRPTLKNCATKHFHPVAGKALPAKVFGLIVDVGQIDGHRIPVPTHIIEANPKKPEESALVDDVLRQVAHILGEDEIGVFDAGFKLKKLQAANVPQYLVRQAKNCTFRRNYLPPYKRKGAKPKWGKVVRPLGRQGKKKWLPATPPDRETSWKTSDGTILKAHIWHDLVSSVCQPSPDNDTVTVVTIFDPRYKKPWILACSLKLPPKTMWQLYRDRWPVEQPPLAAKQMLGAVRQFVFHPISCQRLPELALFAGSILSYVAATMPVIPTGFWDRRPRRTPGRLRRLLLREHFPKLTVKLPERLRKKESPTAHLPKGVAGHRRVAAPK